MSPSDRHIVSLHIREHYKEVTEAKAGAGYRPQAREARHLLALTDLILGQLGLLESLDDAEGLLERVSGVCKPFEEV